MTFWFELASKHRLIYVGILGNFSILFMILASRIVHIAFDHDMFYFYFNFMHETLLYLLFKVLSRMVSILCNPIIDTFEITMAG